METVLITNDETKISTAWFSICEEAGWSPAIHKPEFGTGGPSVAGYKQSLSKYGMKGNEYDAWLLDISFPDARTDGGLKLLEWFLDETESMEGRAFVSFQMIILASKLDISEFEEGLIARMERKYIVARMASPIGNRAGLVQTLTDLRAHLHRER